MPMINIQIMEGRPKEKIARMIAAVKDAVYEELDAPKSNIRVIVSEMPDRD